MTKGTVPEAALASLLLALRTEPLSFLIPEAPSPRHGEVCHSRVREGMGSRHATLFSS